MSISPRQRFRDVLAGPQCVFPGSVYDPISARIAESLGFEVGMFAGSVASLTVLGAPDIIVLTLTEFAEQARRICRASAIPLLCDADHGYGNALNVKRTVEELEAAGVAALTIEDTRLPQPFGEDKPTLISVEEGVGKMRAALAGRRDPALVIAGRTGAAAITGIDDAVERCQAYERAGVDAVFLSGLQSREQLERLASSLKIPIMLGSIGKELNDRDYLSRMGVRIALQGHLPFMAAVQAAHDVLKALRDGTPPDEIRGAAGKDLMDSATRNAEYKSWQATFLRA